MGKELTIVALVGSFIFGMWYFNKGGCETDVKALCWNGPSLEEMVGQIQGGTGDIPEPEEGSDEPPTDPGGSPTEIARMEEGQRRLITEGSTGDRLSSGKPSPISPASRWAHAYYTNNRITVA